MNHAPPDTESLERLRKIAGDGPVLILTHDNPDPDALASGKALMTLLSSAWDIPSRLLYSGLVLRAENRALLNLLTPEWEPADAALMRQSYSAVALVDTQPGAGNNRLSEATEATEATEEAPAGRVPDIVIDHHHPVREGLRQVPFVDVQPQVGATVTLLDHYLEMAGIIPDADLATAMFYGLKTDTRGLSRGTSPADIDAYLKLLGAIDHHKLIQVEQAGLPLAYFQAFSQGLLAAQVYERSVVADLGQMHRPDLAAEMADLLIRLEQARAALCLGLHEETLHLSIRTEPLGEDAGLLVQRVIVPPGKAGGHGTMAGGQVPLQDQDAGPIARAIIERFLAVMEESGAGRSLA